MPQEIRQGVVIINRQKIYNRIRKHLLTQGRKAGYWDCYSDDPENKTFECQYRAYDPEAKKVLKCAIGCLIPFRNYDSTMEGTSIGNSKVYTRIPPSLGVKTEDDRRFLMKLQEIHDNCEPAEWPWNLSAFAKEHGLKVEA